MKHVIIILPVAAMSFGAMAADFSIVDYGAKPDGTKCTEAIARAIIACSQSGGGRVVIPEGRWFSGAIRLRSNVDLHLAPNAEVLFSQNPADYLPAVHTSWEGMECWNYSPLVYAYCCTNVAITGSGTLKAYEGRWEDTFWYPWVWQENGIRAARRQLYDWAATGHPVEKRQIWQMKNANTRPHFIQFNRCKNVRWEGFKIRNSPFWTLHLYLCEDAIVRSLDVYAHGNNNDGVDIEMSRNVLVESCTFDQGDDGIVIKSGRNQDAWRLHTPTENVLIRNCHIKDAHVVLGVGSEISGGVRNVRMENCRAETPLRVIFIKTNHRRGGFIENVTCENITCRLVRESVFEIHTDILCEWAAFPDYETAITRIDGITVRNIKVDEAKNVIAVYGDARRPPTNIVAEGIEVDKMTGVRQTLHNVEGFRDVVGKEGKTAVLKWLLDKKRYRLRLYEIKAYETALLENSEESLDWAICNLSGHWGRRLPEKGRADWWLPRHEERLRQIQASCGRFDLVLVGDSISQGWETAGADALTELRRTRSVLVAGFNGDRTYNVRWRLENGELDEFDAKVVSLLIGTNNWADNTPDEVVADISDIIAVIRRKQPRAKILLMPILPRSDNRSGFKNQKNDEINAMLQALTDGDRVVWFDLRGAFAGAPRELMPDGLHPGNAGYEIWRNALEVQIGEWGK